MPLSKYQPIGIVVLFGLLGCPSNRSEDCAPGQRDCSSAQDMAMLTTESDLAMPTSDPDLAMPVDDLAAPPDFSLPPPSLCPTTGLAGSRKVCNANGYCWESPLPAGRHLFAVSGRDMSNIWAVGNGGAIVKGDYDPPIRTYTDLRMEMPCLRPAPPSQVRSLFRTFRT